MLWVDLCLLTALCSHGLSLQEHTQSFQGNRARQITLILNSASPTGSQGLANSHVMGTVQMMPDLSLVPEYPLIAPWIVGSSRVWWLLSLEGIGVVPLDCSPFL